MKKRLGRPPLSAAEKARRAEERAKLKGAPKKRGRKPGFKLKLTKRGRPVGTGRKASVKTEFPNLVAELAERVLVLEKNWSESCRNEQSLRDGLRDARQLTDGKIDALLTRVNEISAQLSQYFGTPIGQDASQVAVSEQAQAANG